MFAIHVQYYHWENNCCCWLLKLISIFLRKHMLLFVTIACAIFIQTHRCYVFWNYVCPSVEMSGPSAEMSGQYAEMSGQHAEIPGQSAEMCCQVRIFQTKRIKLTKKHTCIGVQCVLTCFAWLCSAFDTCFWLILYVSIRFSALLRFVSICYVFVRFVVFGVSLFYWFARFVLSSIDLMCFCS